MVTKKAAAQTLKEDTVELEVGKPQGKGKLSISAKSALIGDIPAILDFREMTFKHKGEIRISGSDSVEYIHLPDGEFFNVVIADLPNLKEIYAHGSGPTWLDCQNLPNLSKLAVDRGIRWLNVAQVSNLTDIDVGNCEHLGHLSIHHAPLLSRVNIERCRLLPSIQGMRTEDQDRLNLTKQMETAQTLSKRDFTTYPGMTCTDIELVLGNIRRGAELLQKLFPNEDDEIDALNASPSYGYRLLQPGEKVYTGGTGESYCYAFEVTSQESKGKRLIVNILEERGIHEPENAIGEAIRRVISGLGLTGDMVPSEEQLLTFINLRLSAPESDTVSWIETDDVALRLALAANPLMSKSALEQLANDQEPKIRLAVAENPVSELQVRRRLLHGLTKENDPATRIRIARSAAVATEDLEILSKDSNVEMLCAIAENPGCPGTLRAAVLETLATCGESIGLRLVASSSDAPEHLFPLLLASTDQHVIVAIAENIGAPESARSAALEQLAKSDDPKIKQSVARNKLTPPEVLDSLIVGADVELLYAIAKNPLTNASALEHLASNSEWQVRLGVADNPGTPPAVLLALAKDMDARGGESIRRSVAANPAVPVGALKILVKEKDWFIRDAIAENQSTPGSIFEILAKDKKSSVRAHVAMNHAASAAALEILSMDEVGNVKLYVARNPNSTAASLTRLASDPYYAIRRDVASNISTPNSVLQLLLLDSQQEVRNAAQKSLG